MNNMARTKNPILNVFLEGLYDEECVISKLQGYPHILKTIWTDVRSYWRLKIKTPEGDKPDDDDGYHVYGNYDPRSMTSKLYAAPICELEQQYSFPKSTNININMMPFIVGETFQACKLPEYLEPYWDLINICIGHHSDREHHHIWNRREYPSDIGKVYYLTIQESSVKPGKSQRRPGLHVDSPGMVKIKNQDGEESGHKGSALALATWDRADL